MAQIYRLRVLVVDAEKMGVCQRIDSCVGMTVPIVTNSCDYLNAKNDGGGSPCFFGSWFGDADVCALCKVNEKTLECQWRRSRVLSCEGEYLCLGFVFGLLNKDVKTIKQHYTKILRR